MQKYYIFLIKYMNIFFNKNMNFFDFIFYKIFIEFTNFPQQVYSIYFLKYFRFLNQTIDISSTKCNSTRFKNFLEKK